MKALALWQPWASLMAIGAKRCETRSRRWAYRGDLAICSTKRSAHQEETRLCGYARENGFDISCYPSFPTGVVVCVVRVFACYESQSDYVKRMCGHVERMFGDYSFGRFIYFTDNLRRLRTPIPVTGRQGLFNLPSDVEAKVMEQL